MNLTIKPARRGAGEHGYGLTAGARGLLRGFAGLALMGAIAAAQEAGPKAVISLSPAALPVADAHSTVVTLDARPSLPSVAGAALSVLWNAPGATFVDQTGPDSPLAKVTYAGGWHYPVELTVTENGKSDQSYATIDPAGPSVILRGTPVAWQPVELWVRGPMSSESDATPNPFLDYRLQVTFAHPDGSVYSVPGFYAGDGVGGSSGAVWKVRFTPHKGTRWTYRVSFRRGPRIAVSLDPHEGTGLAANGHQGQLIVFERDPEAEGFLKWGRLEYVGEHYLKFRDGGYFIKGGTDSPENLLGYRGFDDIQDNGGIGVIHEYAGHVADWRPGDPDFASNTTGYDSKGLIGALNYLSSKHVNSVYFLPMNLGGDGQETCPFVGYSNNVFDKCHYDVSRMHQWNQVFDHAQRQGIMLHVVLAETETANEQWLDNGQLGPERKLFFREMIARFGHALALKWNLSEENDFSIQELQECADYIRALDPYDHPIAVHTWSNNFSDYSQIVGDERFTSTSIQYDPDLAGFHVENWRQQSEASGRKWIIELDENNPYNIGLMDNNADEMRKRVLYDVFFSGGQIEWYAGWHNLPLGGDLTLEDFRTREPMWNYMWYARRFMQTYLPLPQMEPQDGLISGESNTWGGAEVFAKPGDIYAIYYPNAESTGSLDLGGSPGTFTGLWHNPRTGSFEGSRFQLQGGGVVSVGPPPSAQTEDWVLYLRRD